MMMSKGSKRAASSEVVEAATSPGRRDMPRSVRRWAVRAFFSEEAEEARALGRRRTVMGVEDGEAVCVG